MIQVENIRKSYGDVQAVKDVSFAAVDGKITTLLGANGSGKTTTFNAIAGLMKMDAGAVHVDGIDVASKTVQAQQRLGHFPDTFGLYARLTTREHLAYFAQLHGMAGSDLKAAVSRTIDRLKMQDIADRKTEGFSQGQRMKVALGRTLVHDPDNIVLDEPTRGLDVMSIRLLRRVLQDLRGEGKCILLSSHVMAEVSFLSDDIVMIAEGEIVAKGTAEELITHSGEQSLEDAFVALTGMENTGATQRRRVS